MRKCVLFLFALNVILSCSKLDDDYSCQIEPLVEDLNRVELMTKFDSDMLEKLASIETPNEEGALGRNKSAYFHVRFQMGLSAQADFAVGKQNGTALENTIKAIEYSFQHQLPAGDFELVVPSNLNGETANESDLTSGTAFFMAGLGLALIDFEMSEWYNSTENETKKNRIEMLRPAIILAGEWLKSKKELLLDADSEAPNRLLFDAIAFYGIGRWTNNPELQIIGEEFISKTLALKDTNGYFLELDGWDTSYQGVAVNNGLNLYSILSDTNSLKSVVWNDISCAGNWQNSRVLSNGKISSRGNTRVHLFGESFLGKRKKIDWVDTMSAFYMLYYYSENKVYLKNAKAIYKHYV
jgi:hypothetical protein